MKVGEFGHMQPGLFVDVETIDTKGCARFRNEYVGRLRQREPTQPEFHRDLERRSRAQVDLVAGIREASRASTVSSGAPRPPRENCRCPAEPPQRSAPPLEGIEQIVGQWVEEFRRNFESASIFTVGGWRVFHVGGRRMLTPVLELAVTQAI